MTLRSILTLPIILSCFLGHSQTLTTAESAEKPVLRIVYFTPSDRDPIPGYADRLEKVLEHVREFFRNGMATAGYGQRTFNLDRKEDGSLRIFVVRGEYPTEKYGRDSGWIVQRECRKALLKEGVDLQTETVVIFNNLLLWEGKKAIEHGPYAGGGNHRNGFAWAYDDAMLDPARLGSKEPGGFYHRPCSTGEFNSHYIGGIAHELGHGLGLPHVCQKLADRQRGTALMGSGNHTWGREQRGEGPGTFLTKASAMQLSTNHLFADDLKEPDGRATCRLEGLDANWSRGRLTLSGRLVADPPVYGVIAFNDGYARAADYDAVGWTADVGEDGRFTVDIEEFQPGKFQLRLMACHASGQKNRFNVDYETSAEGRPDPGVFLGLLLPEAVRAYGSGDRARAQAVTQSILAKNASENETTRKAQHLLTLFEAREPMPPNDLPEGQKSVALTDLEFLEESVGWRRPMRDRVPIENGGTCFLEVGGRFAERGLYAHAPSRYAIKIGKVWKRLNTSFGLQAGHPGSVVFVVRGNGRELFRSKVITDQKLHSANLNVSDVDTVELIVENGGNGNGGDWGVWLEPTLMR